MSFEWGRIHKWEENIERDIIQSVEEYICEFYDVEMIDFLSEEQIKEVHVFSKDVLNSESIMQFGLKHVIEMWAIAQSEDEIIDVEDWVNNE